MRIALVAPLHESVPPRSYRGTKRIVFFLAEELVKKVREDMMSLRYKGLDRRMHQTEI